MVSLSKQELGYLVGFFLGDGYANYNKKNRHYNTEFYFNSLRDIQSMEFIKTLLGKFGLNVCKQKDKRYNCIRLKVSSKEFMRFILFKKDELFDESKTNGLDEEYKLGVISGFIDAEGYVNNGEIQLTQKDKRMLIMIKELCKDLSITTRKFYSTKNYKTDNLIWRLRISTKFKYMPHNSYKVKRVYSKIQLN